MPRARDIKGTKSAKIIERRGKNLPTTIFVKYEISSDDPYLVASENIEDLAEKDETSYVAEYRRVKTGKVKLNLHVS